MPSASTSKRKAASSQPESSTTGSAKRARKNNAPTEIIVIEDSDEEDEELKEILAQIEAQEASESLAKQLQCEFTGDVDTPMEDDEALARRLAEEWAKEENALEEMTASSHYSKLPDSSSSSIPAQARTRFVDIDASVSKGKAKECKVTYTKPDEALATYRSTFTRSRPCSSCGKDVKSPRGCVMFSDAPLPPSLAYLLHAPCNACRTNHCRGCFTPLDCPPSCKGPLKNSKCGVFTCCAEVRAIAIFETLGGFDRQYISHRAESDSRALVMSKTKPNSRSVGPGGTGYGTDNYGANIFPKHIPYASPAATHSRSSRKAQTKTKATSTKASTNWDSVVLHAIELLIQLLPSPYNDKPHGYDLLPHPSIGDLLSLSQLPTLLATLLRNDSVTDWIARKEIYNGMLSLLRCMAGCELAIQCLIEQRLEMATTCGLENWIWEDGEITWKTASTGELETLPPLYTYFKKLTTQSEAFLAGATQMLGEAADDEIDDTMIEGTSLCGDIIAARDDLERAIAVLGQPSSNADRDNRTDQAENTTHSRRTNTGKGRDLSADADRAYEEACEKLCFKYVSLTEDATAGGEGLHYANFKYAPLLNQTQNSTRNPKGRLHLLKELAVTATSLPPGVWVRVDEVRNDAIKIMIAGPEGTPYAGGLFEFDCYIPLEYPNTAPQMHLRTTGGGTVRFNPNLYNCGKVCLSLLGTWPGRPEEQWSPKSTLLQVLVSIQGMILIDAPYYNEPGYGQADVKAPVSISYNYNISAKTMEWAIIDWLQDKHRNGIWRDVIKSHFTTRHEKIRQQIIEWCKEPAPLTRHPEFYYQAPPSRSSSVVQRADLLAEFDKGFARIESWKSDGDEEK